MSPHLQIRRNIFVYGDKEQLLRVFTNLIKNGIQSIPNDREGIIQISLKIKKPDVIVQITDNGIGIPNALKDKLFQPNFTTKSGGMGLGLAIVKNIVESINGQIWFKTEINKGTTFYIQIPQYKKNPPSKKVD